MENSIEAAVADELWVSLTSLIRSYAAAHSLNGKAEPKMEMGGGVIRMECHNRRLVVRREGQSVIWSRENGQIGRFEITQAGRLRNGDSEEEMDMVAEGWMRELMR